MPVFIHAPDVAAGLDDSSVWTLVVGVATTLTQAGARGHGFGLHEPDANGGTGRSHGMNVAGFPGDSIF